MVQKLCNISAGFGKFARFIKSDRSLGSRALAAAQIGGLLLVSSPLAACSHSKLAPADAEIASTNLPAKTVSSQASPKKAAPSASAQAYNDGIKLASSAFVLGQSAQSSDDWQLVSSRWQRAMLTLETIPPGDANYATAQAKLSEYERNYSYAQQRLEQLKNPPPLAPMATPARPPANASETADTSASVSSDGSAASGDLAAGSSDSSGRRFIAPILSRQRGTPVIEVTFNGGRRYPMILDTGASHTLITRTMANELGVVAEGQISATTASNQNVVFDIGKVDSIQVSGIIRQNLKVGIGDSVDIGLLGNDFYEAFDLVLQEQSVEFRVR